MTKLEINAELVQKTLQLLKEFTNKERVVLWLGKKQNDRFYVTEIFLPLQETEEDSFYIPEEGMDELMSHLRSRRMMMVAQIHTHPFEAFHSKADDVWAIVRHVNAYSLVVPHFCKTTELSNLLKNTAAYVLDEKNRWREVSCENLIIV